MKNQTDTAPPKNIDEYIASFPENVQVALEELRQIIREAAPEAEEAISYMMPTFKYHGNLVHFAGFKNHCTFFVGSGSFLPRFQHELKDYTLAKSGIHFTPDKPIPKSLIQKMVWERMLENEEIARKKSKKTKKE